MKKKKIKKYVVVTSALILGSILESIFVVKPVGEVRSRSANYKSDVSKIEFPPNW